MSVASQEEDEENVDQMVFYGEDGDGERRTKTKVQADCDWAAEVVQRIGAAASLTALILTNVSFFLVGLLH